MKKNNNKIHQPLILISSATLLLFFLSFSTLPLGFFNGQRTIDILADIRKTEPKRVPIIARAKETTQQVITHLTQPKDSTFIVDFGFDSINSLQYFFQKLDNIKVSHNKVRIAYFGDSFVEGDEMTLSLIHI